MARRSQFVTLGWFAVGVCAMLPGAARAASPNHGKVNCGACHRAEAQAQPTTPMGIGIELPPNQAPLEAHRHLAVDLKGYRYTVDRKNGASTYTVSDGSGSITLPIRYAFGAANLTFVLEYQGHFYEGLASYYEAIQGLGLTIGDDRIQPHNLVEAMGRPTPDQEITACFECHGTGGVSQGKLTLASLQPGVKCEHCHTGAEAHMQGLAGGKSAPVPRKLGEMGAEEMSNFCGECHRTWESVVGLRLFGEKNVRFQPYRLANSKCFLGDDKRIRCTACHDPHQPLVREEASYDRVCLSCHATRTAPGTLAAAVTPAVNVQGCPVADSKCVSCHMAKVQVPGSPAIFRDHEIRVVRAGAPYPP